MKFFDSENLQAELAALKKAAIEKEAEQVEIDSDSLNNKPDLDFYDKLKNTRLQTYIAAKQPEKIAIRTKKQRKGDSFQTAQKNKNRGTQRKTETFQAVQKPGKNRNGEPQRKTEIFQTVQKLRTDNTTQQAEVRKKITIQVASFRNPQDADRLVKRLNARGYGAYTSTGSISGEGTWHRVRIGHFNKRDEARSTMNKLKKDNLIAILVRD